MGESVPRGNVAGIAAGTGLGEALLAWHGDVPVAIASEGGHADFAPRGSERIPVRVALSGKASLVGAATVAARAGAF